MSTVLSYLDRNGQYHFDAKAGWRWSTEYHRPVCPTGEFLKPHDIRCVGPGGFTIRFRGTYGACSACPERCSPAIAPRFRKERTVSLPPDAVLQEEPAGDLATARTAPDLTATPWLPPDPALRPGPYAMRHTMLLPAELRKEFDRLCGRTVVTVAISLPPPTPPTPKELALTPAEKQHRRRTWTDRFNWNALPEAAVIDITTEGPHELRRLRSDRSHAEAA